MAQYTIRNVIDSILRGTIRVPAFQRGFVWDPDDVAFFMDSIYKGYPFGSLLFWRAKEPLKSERQLGPYKLPEKDPDYPVDYILDGQQRITSIFGVFQTELKEESAEPWTQIFFDFTADPNAQESQFLALEKPDLSKHFPLRTTFDTTEYRKATKDMSEDIAKKIDEMQARFKEAQLPIQTFETSSRSTVAIVFERVNRKGVPLDTLQLLSAWTWSEEFDLQKKFEDLQEQLEPFGFSELGEDATLLLRCCAAILSKDAAPDTLVALNGALVREQFDTITNGIKGAIDFLRVNLEVHSIQNLPYSTFLVPLCVFFAAPGNQHTKYSDAQRSTILRWFWKACFAKRYSSGVLRSLKYDIEQMAKLRENEANDLGQFTVVLPGSFYTTNKFRVDSVNNKTFILQLAQHKPLSFMSGTPVTLQEVLRLGNRSEFHHIFPQAYLRGSKQVGEGKHDDSCLANMCFLTRSDNNAISDDAPSVYRKKMPPEIEPILKSALCPAGMFNDDYAAFVDQRTKLLIDDAGELMTRA